MRVILLLICLWVNLPVNMLYGQRIDTPQNQPGKPWLQDLQYIYNRALDMSLKDNMSGLEARSVFYSNTQEYDSIIISIDTLLSRRSFYVEGIDSLRGLNFEDSLDVEAHFRNIYFLNNFKINYSHYDRTPTLKENHLVHVTFSDIYILGDKFYLGVLLEQKLEIGAGINFPDYFIFQVEWCNQQFILFRKLYHPIGSDGTRNSYYMRDLEDRKCQR